MACMYMYILGIYSESDWRLIINTKNNFELCQFCMNVGMHIFHIHMNFVAHYAMYVCILYCMYKCLYACMYEFIYEYIYFIYMLCMFVCMSLICCNLSIQ